MLIKSVSYLLKVEKFLSAEMKFPQLLLYKSKLLTDLAQILIGVFYIIIVYVYEGINNKKVVRKLLTIRVPAE